MEMVLTTVKPPVMPLLLLLLLLLASGGESYSGKVLLVSMDGFRWDYIQRVSGLGNFTRLQNSGCSVQYVNNTFITKSYPNHFTIVTGLFEENHGVVANKMYDPERNASFSYLSKEDFWWQDGEPIWVTAERQAKKAAAYFWPGSEAEIRGYRPSEYREYNRTVPFPERVETVIRWFVQDAMDFVALYFFEPDTTGHIYGPNSTEVDDKVREMDGVLGQILDELEQNHLTAVVNVIVTSDHGMADVSVHDRLLNLWEYVNRSMVERVPDFDVVTAILPKAGWETAVLTAASQIPHITAYRKEDIPDHFHYKHHSRIMPIILVADEGWLLSADYNATVKWNGKGAHGYDNTLPSMKSIFFARGPDFRKGVKSTSIQSVDIYPLLCRLLNIEAAPNNGSLAHTAHFLLDNMSLAKRLDLSIWIIVASLMIPLIK